MARKPYAACQALLTPALGSLDVVREVCYGQEAIYENVARLTEDPVCVARDVLSGIGGGKCLDTVKLPAINWENRSSRSRRSPPPARR